MNTPEQNIINTLSGKKVLFIENDNSLDTIQAEFKSILINAGIDVKVIYGASTIPINELHMAIDTSDCIVFMTQWVFPISKALLKYVSNLPQKKIIVECYIYEPTWFYSEQHGTHHDLYVYTYLDFGRAKINGDEHFYKITDKPYWDYENEFDK